MRNVTFGDVKLLETVGLDKEVPRIHVVGEKIAKLGFA